jgi:hypothetical protein
MHSDALPDAATAHESYKALVRQINGLLRAQFGFFYSGVSVDYVIEVPAEGVRRRTAVAESNVVGPVLPAESPPPEPLAMAALADVRADVDLAEAVGRYAETPRTGPTFMTCSRSSGRAPAAVQWHDARLTPGSAARRSVSGSRRLRTCIATRARRRGHRTR